MKLVTDSLMKAAFQNAIKDRADQLETKVVAKFKNAMINPCVEAKMLAMLEGKANPELTQSGVIREAQSAVNVAFKNKNDYETFSKKVYEAMELLALSLVIVDEETLEKRKKDLVEA